MENPKNQLADKLKDASNVLVTVSTNPTVDQLSAAIGLTLFLTKLKKHATTVFSGQIPSTIDFLKPEETIETNTDSLRDFIISLDKNKADKIRYKVEDTMVKIFITPYRTSITEEDLVFSQGDFNVDVVVALGIQKREDIDQAIMAHGRILHDATVATVNISEDTDLGTLNWADPQASSLCEMMVALADLLQANSLDGQMATALLTGIVAETERFSNEKTSSTTMSASAKLMAAGANQQLVATKLQPPEDEPPLPKGGSDSPDDDGDMPQDATLEEDGSLRINHQSTIPEASDAPPLDTLPEPWTPDMSAAEDAGVVGKQDEAAAELHIEKSRQSTLSGPPSSVPRDDVLFGLPQAAEQPNQPGGGEGISRMATEPPQFGGQLTAATQMTSNESSPFDLAPRKYPMLSRRPAPPSEEDEPPKPTDDGPPEPYTVFEPDPESQKTDEPADPPAIPPTPTAPKSRFRQIITLGAGQPSASPEPLAADLRPPQPNPAAPSVPVPDPADKPRTGHAFVDLGDSTLDQIEDKVSPGAKKQAEPTGLTKPDEDIDYKQEAVKHVAKVMSDKTLDQLEEKIGRPRADRASQDAADEDIDYKQEAVKHVAKVMSDKTLDQLEEKIGRPQEPQVPSAKVVPAEKPKEEAVSALKYEAHESEPKEKIEKSEGAKTANAEPVDKPKTDEKQKSEKEADSSPVAAKKPEVAATLSTPANLKKSDKPQTITPEPKKKPEPTPAPEAEKAKQDEARDAVMRAINAGGDGRTSLPPLEAVGTAGAMEVSHSEATGSDNQAESSPPPVPPPMPATPRHTGPSPNISIDPEDGTLIPLPPNLVPNSDELPADVTAAASEASPPPVPPPMVPPVQKV